MEIISFITLIIYSNNKANKLRKTLESLKCLEFARYRLDILIVDDNSVDTTSKVVKNFSKTSNIRVIYYKKDKKRSKGHILNSAYKYLLSNTNYYKKSSQWIIGLFEAGNVLDANILKSVSTIQKLV